MCVLDFEIFVNLLNSLLQTADNGGVSVVNNILDSYGAPVARSPFVPLLVRSVKCRHCNICARPGNEFAVLLTMG